MSKPKPGYTVRWFFGGVLMAVGFLMAALSGLCSAGVVVFTAIGGKSDNNEFLFALMLVALVGGPPIVLGGLLYVVGRFLRGSGL
jgi:hypothetical protein